MSGVTRRSIPLPSLKWQRQDLNPHLQADLVPGLQVGPSYFITTYSVSILVCKKGKNRTVSQRAPAPPPRRGWPWAEAPRTGRWGTFLSARGDRGARRHRTRPSQAREPPGQIPGAPGEEV